jgi:flagellin-like hook-associated protein FlgL
MLSPNSPIFGNLSHATGKAMLDLQRGLSKSLKVKSTELAISEGNSGDASYSARLSSLSDHRKVESDNLQNLMSFGQMQDAGLEKALAITDRMGNIAGSASNSLISENERSILHLEFESLKLDLAELQDVQFQGYNLFKASENNLSIDAGDHKIIFEPAAFDNLAGYSVSSETNASVAGAKILDELDTILEKRSKIGSITNQILMSTDRLDTYFVAEQAHLAKKERDFAATSIDLAKKSLHSKATSALLVQAQGINQNLVNKLL